MAAILTEMKFKDLDSFSATTIGSISQGLGQTELFLKTEAMAGLVFAITGVAVVFGIIALIGRLLNAKHETSTNRVFTSLVRKSKFTADTCIILYALVLFFCTLINRYSF